MRQVMVQDLVLVLGCGRMPPLRWHNEAMVALTVAQFAQRRQQRCEGEVEVCLCAQHKSRRSAAG